MKVNELLEASNNDVTTKFVNKEGISPDGKEYNMLYVIEAPTKMRANMAEYRFDSVHWGAKTVVDKEFKDSKNGVTLILYVVDNHKYGRWKSKQDFAETATAGATSSANIATVVNPNVAIGKKNVSYTGTPGHSGTKAPKSPKVTQPKKKDGTAVNALDIKGTNLFGGSTISR